MICVPCSLTNFLGFQLFSYLFLLSLSIVCIVLFHTYPFRSAQSINDNQDFSLISHKLPTQQPMHDVLLSTCVFYGKCYVPCIAANIIWWWTPIKRCHIEVIIVCMEVYSCNQMASKEKMWRNQCFTQWQQDTWDRSITNSPYLPWNWLHLILRFVYFNIIPAYPSCPGKPDHLLTRIWSPHRPELSPGIGPTGGEGATRASPSPPQRLKMCRMREASHRSGAIWENDNIY